jgi:uncharacterized membrane protein
VWFGIHPVIAGSKIRWALVARVGENAFRALFSLLSAGALTLLLWQYSRAAFYPLWFAPGGVRHLPLLIVPVGLLLFVGSFTVPNPTVVRGERLLDKEARGVLRITRHPFLWGVLLWAVAHMLVNGDVAALLFFGSFALTAVVGAFDIDRKRRTTNPEEWARFAAATSNLPFAAIVSGRNRLALRELALPLALTGLLSALLLYFHGPLFGASALPMPR